MPATGMGRPGGNIPRIGIRPDYGNDLEGVLLNGVNEGSPAQKAGLKEGDLIVEVGGKAAKNLQAYMVLMGAQPKDKPIELSVLRDGKKLSVKVSLE